MATTDEIRFLERQLQIAREDVQRFGPELESVRRKYEDAVKVLEAARTLLDAVQKGSGAEEIGEFTGMLLKDAVFLVMRRADRPMRAGEVLKVLEAGRARIRGKTPAQSITALLSTDNRYERVDVGLYRISLEGSSGL